MWPDEFETGELLKRAAGADPEAVNHLLARHRESLRRMIALRLDPALRRRVDASDIVQGVLLEASRRLPDYVREPAIPFSLWLRQLARDHLIDAHRRHRQAQRRSLDREQPMALAAFSERSSLELASELLDRQPTPAAAAIVQEFQRRFQAALWELGEDDREILLLRHSEQLSNIQTAQALGLSEAAAGMRYVRALRRLRRLLGQPPSGESRA